MNKPRHSNNTFAYVR